MLANCHRNPKKKSSPYRPSDFDPYAPLPPPLTKAQKEAAAKAFASAWKVS